MEKIHFMKECHANDIFVEFLYKTACGETITFDPFKQKWELPVADDWDNVTCSRCMNKRIREIYRKLRNKKQQHKERMRLGAYC